MAGEKEILRIENLEKGFDELDVIKGISLTVNEGEVVAIIGPSGSGKSTLLRCATLLERADRGSISYCGEYAAKADAEGRSVYADADSLKKIRSRFGLVFQSFNLFPHMSVLRNITDAPVVTRGVAKEQAEQTAIELLRKLGLEDKAKSYPCQLSGGQQQRVSIARALAMNPDILFFDEPTSALDPELTGEILRVIRNLAAENMTMVIVTHEMDFAEKVADRVVFMDGGVIVEQGAAADVIGNPQMERTKEFLQKYEL